MVTEVSPFSTAGVESLCLRQELGYYANTGASEAYVKMEMCAVVGNSRPECVCTEFIGSLTKSNLLASKLHAI